MSPRHERTTGRTALLAACAAALSVASCSDPLPPVAFEEWIRPPPLSIHGCGWTRTKDHEPAVECTLALARPHEMHALAWTGYSLDGRAIAFGGTGLAPWNPGEERRITFHFDKRTGEPVTRIKLDLY